MRRWMWLLCTVPMALGGCSDDDRDGWCDHGGYDGSGSGQVGVSFDLSGAHDRLEALAPVKIMACFDSDCDTLTLRLDQREPRCEGAPGGPPDQLTGCSFDRAGNLSVSIVRIDNQDYTDGAPHTAAISITDAHDARVLSYAEQVRFSTSGIVEVTPE